MDCGSVSEFMQITVFLVVFGRIFYNYNGVLFCFRDKKNTQVCSDNSLSGFTEETDIKGEQK